MSKALWYADGLRWIGGIFNGAAENLERNAAESTPLDPRTYREIEQYIDDLHRRVHVHI